MFKKYSGQAARRQLGLALLALTALAGSGAIQAAEADANTGAVVELKLDFKYVTVENGSPKTYQSQSTLRVPDGKAVSNVSYTHSGQPELSPLVASYQVEALAGDRIKVSIDVKKGIPAQTIAKPQLITANGVKASIETGKAGEDMLSISVTPTLIAKSKS